MVQVGKCFHAWRVACGGVEMRLHRVKVISCAMRSYWYANSVGQEFTVTWAGGLLNDRLSYKVIYEGTFKERPCASYLQVSDCEVLETFEGRIVEQVIISVERT